VRIDRLLCNLRFLRTRTLAAKLVGGGHLRRNGVRVIRASQEVAVGDVLTIPVSSGVRLVEVLALPEKRGPARAAQACYRILDPRGESDIGAGEAQIAEGDARP
jgi:ribosome-associated heat shock protein Hsp15